MKKMLLLGAVALLAATGMARADGPSPVEIRQTGLDLMSADFAGIRAVVAAKGDVKPLEASALAIQRWAAIMPAFFPAGTEAGTKAKPDIWTDMDGFKKAAATLGSAAGTLAAAAKAGDADAVAAAVKGVGQACGACHNSYKAK